MKVALIRQRYTPFGGAERFVDRALGPLRRQGAELTLICRNWAAPDAAAEGTRVLTCDPPYARHFGGRRARDRSFAEGVQKILAGEHFDIVQSHERIPGCQIFRAGDGVHAAWLAHLGRARPPVRRLALRVSPYHRYVCEAERAMLAHPALRAVICNSRLVRDEFVGRYGVAPHLLHVIPNGVDLGAFHPGLADQYRVTVRCELGFAADDFVFLFVGGGFERKGAFRLLRAFAALPTDRARLVIVGGDRHLGAAHRLAERLGCGDRVRLTGPRDDVRPFLGAADAFVLPTLYDPLPNAALEALASGLPLLTSTTCGAAELIRDGESGFVCDALDEAAIGERLLRLMAGACRREAARAAVEELGLERMAERLTGLYARVLAASGQPCAAGAT